MVHQCQGEGTPCLQQVLVDELLLNPNYFGLTKLTAQHRRDLGLMRHKVSCHAWRSCWPLVHCTWSSFMCTFGMIVLWCIVTLLLDQSSAGVLSISSVSEEFISTHCVLPLGLQSLRTWMRLCPSTLLTLRRPHVQLTWSPQWKLAVDVEIVNILECWLSWQATVIVLLLTLVQKYP